MIFENKKKNQFIPKKKNLMRFPEGKIFLKRMINYQKNKFISDFKWNRNLRNVQYNSIKCFALSISYHKILNNPDFFLDIQAGNMKAIVQDR